MIAGKTKNQSETVVLNLSDDIYIDTIVISEMEDFSAKLSEIILYGSIDYNGGTTETWTKLGSVYPEKSYI